MAAKDWNWIKLAELAKLLSRLGFLVAGRGAARKKIQAAGLPLQIQEAVLSYQSFHGLKQDGWVGPKTFRHIQLPRFCKQPDRMKLGRWGSCKWPFKDPTWTVMGSLPSFAPCDIRDIGNVAVNRWWKICGIAPMYKSNARTANIVMTTANLGGPGGTLADSQLPCGNVERSTSLRQRYDTQERFVYKDGQLDPWEIDLGRTILHELGHAFGVPHIGGGNLMAPTHSPTIYLPQFGDIGEMTERYGSPVEGKTPGKLDQALKYINIVVRGKIVSITEK